MPTKARVAIAQLKDGKEKQFALFLSEGKSHKTAARLAGYSMKHRTNFDKVAQRPRVKEAVTYLQARYADSIVATRKKVLEGFLEAIEQAKLQADPAVQISGWREIGKMCGYYAPEVKEVNVNIGAKRVIGQLEVMSDAELLEMIEKDREAIEGEAALLLTEPPREEPSE